MSPLCDPLAPTKRAEEESTSAHSHSSLGDLVGSDGDDEGTDPPEAKIVRNDIVAKDEIAAKDKMAVAREDSGIQILVHGSWKDEAWDILTVGVPMCASGVGRTLQMMATQAILGNLDTKVLAATSAANIWTTVMSTMLQSGMGQVVTLCSQAYGAENYRLVATWCHITLVYHTLVAIPFTLMRWFTADVLIIVGVEEEVAELAGLFTFYAQSVLVFELWYHTFRAYFAGQTIVWPDAIVIFVFVVVWYGCMHIAVNVLHGGIVGAAVAQAIGCSLQFFVFVGISFAMGYHKKTWYTPDFDEIFVWGRWKTLLTQVVPAGITGLVEQVLLQGMFLIAACISEPLLAAQAFAGSLAALSFMFAFGASGATGIRMGRFLGEGRAQAAKYTSIVGGVLVSCVNCVLGLVIAFILPYWARTASNDPRVWEEIDRGRWIVGIAVSCLGGFVVMANVIMKQGRPHIVGLSLVVWTWLLGIPISYFMAPRFGLLGIWTGITIGYGSALLCLLFFFLRSDWDLIAQQARLRAELTQQAEKEETMKPEEQAEAVK